MNLWLWGAVIYLTLLCWRPICSVVVTCGGFLSVGHLRYINGRLHRVTRVGYFTTELEARREHEVVVIWCSTWDAFTRNEKIKEE
jgi:hypothetical protein